ncbi:MAG: L,D-transpeptidase [Gammaproteobacteria bacterium]|nr:L,D-transpeptidase [Gammaproteobacteria bacterium]
MLAVAIIWICVGISACVHSPPSVEPEDVAVHEPEVAPPVMPPPVKVETQRLTVPSQGWFILVAKANRQMTVYSDGKIVHRYDIGLGFQPSGHKRWQGDGRTPEGHYSVAVKNPRSRYFLSLGLNYPLPADGAKGYAQGRISWDQYQAIEDAYAGRKVPPWNTRLGGAIFIHGRGAAGDWTHGCIALENADMQQLYNLVDVGTPVTIVP